MLTTRQASTFVFATFAATILGGCMTTNTSDARLLYGHCREPGPFWDSYVRETRPKAMVAGLNYNLDGKRTFNCYWRWGDSYATASESALVRCRQEYQKCYTYAQGNNEEDWVREERLRIAEEEQRAVDDFIGSFVDGLQTMSGR